MSSTGGTGMSSQKLSFASIGALALISLSLPSTALSQGVFLKNLQPLDDEVRGYCLDVRRAPPNVDLDARLGTHACKYGMENVDQQFEWRAPDQLYLPEYDRCLTAARFDVGAELFVRSCADTEQQSWVVSSDGQNHPHVATGSLRDALGRPTCGEHSELDLASLSRPRHYAGNLRGSRACASAISLLARDRSALGDRAPDRRHNAGRTQGRHSPSLGTGRRRQ